MLSVRNTTKMNGEETRLEIGRKLKNIESGSELDKVYSKLLCSVVRANRIHVNN